MQDRDTNTMWNRMLTAKQNSCPTPLQTKTTNNNKKTLNFTSFYVCRFVILACIIIFKEISSRRKKFAIKTALRQYKGSKNIENGTFPAGAAGLAMTWLAGAQHSTRCFHDSTDKSRCFIVWCERGWPNDESVLQFTECVHFVVSDDVFSDWMLHVHAYGLIDTSLGQQA